MPTIVHWKDGKVFRRYDLTAEQVADIPNHKKGYLLLEVKDPRPNYDPITHHHPIKSEGPDPVDNPTRYLHSWSVPVAKTSQEIADSENAEKENTLNAYDAVDGSSTGI